MRFQNSNLFRRTKLIIFTLLTIIVSFPAITTSSTAQEQPERYRYMVDMDVINKSIVKVQASKVDYNTGLAKVDNLEFDDPSLTKHFSPSEYVDTFYSTVVSTPKGIKAYSVMYQSIGGKRINTIYEFDFDNQTLRKVKDSLSDVTLYPDLGIYLVSDKNRNYYSLIDNKLLFSGGTILRQQEFTNMEYYIDPAPKSMNFAIYYPGTWFQKPDPNKQSYYLNYGGLKGATVKVKAFSSSISTVDTKGVETYKSFYGDLTLKLIVPPSKNRSYYAIKGGKKTLLVSGEYDHIRPYVSPNQKYLLIIAEKTKGFTVTSSRVYLYDMKTLKSIRSYDSEDQSSATKVYWITNDIYFIDYYNSINDRKPNYLHDASSGALQLVKNSSASDHYYFYYWDSFQDIKMGYFPDVPTSVSVNKVILNYTNYPTFKLNGKYYIPLDDFTSTYNINYIINDKDVKLLRNERETTIPRDSIYSLWGEQFIPLGDWNKELGLKVINVQMFVSHNEITINDEDK
ncbi:hypothetical protein AWM70_04810 [Paenibacillus yonginensis]|uniref:DUF5050 domain-containing protein n=1 Tax=Paenibacillus yonginensis TaxID=1462996 RepID=A0A1B1MXS4_9BACL|nr:hypothetical protein [Paenibacillus yonginensis]ANS73974.1 hypothetical protein AWM70_04810 [Paenibacillus yonginensis]